MGCRLDDFVIGRWDSYMEKSKKVEYAPAMTGRLEGFVYKIDGRFRGFVGTLDGVKHWATEEIEGRTP
jgi:hypothetical protein